MSGIDQLDLQKFGVNKRLINRLLTQFGKNVPEPPTVMLGHKADGEYHAINEYYAMKFFLAQGIHPAVSKVRALIGGTTKTVNDNINALKAEYPRDTFKLPDTKNDERDPFEKARKEVLANARNLFNVELEEADERHTKELVQIEEAHELEVQKIKAQLHEAIGRNTEMASMLRDAQAKAKDAQDELKKTSVDHRALSDAKATIESLKSELADKQESLKKLFTVNETITKAGADRTDELNREIKRLNSQLQKDQLALHEKDKAIATYQEANSTYASERDEYRSKSFELESQLKQAKLTIANEHHVDELLASIEKQIKPLAAINDLILEVQGNKAGLNKNTKALADISANLLTLQGKLGKSAK